MAATRDELVQKLDAAQSSVIALTTTTTEYIDIVRNTFNGLRQQIATLQAEKAALQAELDALQASSGNFDAEFTKANQIDASAQEEKNAVDVAKAEAQVEGQ